MTDRQRLLAQLAALFCFGGLGLYFLIGQTSTKQGPLLPYPLLAFLLLALLFLVTVVLSNNLLTRREKLELQLREDLERAARELESTKISQEERVERRTFEISVANAALNREIAERIQAEAESQRIKHQMELILESAGEGIYGLDAKGNVTFVNRAAALMLGWEAQDLIGRSHHQLVHHTKANGEDYPVSECPISQSYQDGLVHFGSDEVFWAKDGSRFPVEYVSTPIKENGRLTGAVVVFRDISTFS